MTQTELGSLETALEHLREQVRETNRQIEPLVQERSGDMVRLSYLIEETQRLRQDFDEWVDKIRNLSWLAISLFVVVETVGLPRISRWLLRLLGI